MGEKNRCIGDFSQETLACWHAVPCIETHEDVKNSVKLSMLAWGWLNLVPYHAYLNCEPY